MSSSRIRCEYVLKGTFIRKVYCVTVSGAPETAPIEPRFCRALPLVPLWYGTYCIRDSAASTHSLHDLHLYKPVVSLEGPRTFSSLFAPPVCLARCTVLPSQLFLLSITPAITNYFAFLSTQPFDSSTPFVTASLDVFNATPDAQRPNS